MNTVYFYTTQLNTEQIQAISGPLAGTVHSRLQVEQCSICSYRNNMGINPRGEMD